MFFLARYLVFSSRRPKLHPFSSLKRMPLGATASVNDFLSTAHSLWFRGCVSGLLMWTSYLDNFLFFSPPSYTTNAGAVAETVFNSTGWIYGKEGWKHLPFASVIAVLGVQIHLSHCKDGMCFFGSAENDGTMFRATSGAIRFLRKLDSWRHEVAGWSCLQEVF